MRRDESAGSVLIPGLYLNHIVWFGFVLAGGADAEVSGLVV
jgi:hypothetical protein